MSIKSISLSDGNAIPWIGFGTGTATYKQDCTDSVLRAVKSGFTHFDGAQLYENEDSFGNALQQSGIAREKAFITTKLGMLQPGESVEDSLRGSLKKLHLESVDLFLVHAPILFLTREDGLKGIWREMVAVKEKGLARSIGVSNFTAAQLEEIVNMGLEKPVINQIEYHLLLAKSRSNILEYAKTQNIVIAAYGGMTPIIPNRAEDESLAEARKTIAATLDKLAAARGKDVTQSQIILKWLQANGMIAITTSSKESRIKEYLDAENLTDLTPTEQEELNNAAGSVYYSVYPLFDYMINA